MRQLGYLRNPLESFVAGHATRQGLVRALLGVSFRLGAVGGLLAALIGVALVSVIILVDPLKLCGDRLICVHKQEQWIASFLRRRFI